MKKELSIQENLLSDIKRLLILNLIKQGATNAEIGAVLGVSYKTIENIVPPSIVSKPKK
jgi:DNA-binding NarL/FixJ family response regulator